jgi:F-type H+-transporting ATPase subunit delta
MSSNRTAIRYAKAILESAHSKNVSAVVASDMKMIASTLDGNIELRTFIQNPTIKVGAKESALQAIFVETSAVTKGLFRLLLENKRFEILGEIATQYNHLDDEQNGIEIAKVTSAVAMDVDLEAKVLAKIATLSNNKVLIQNNVDPSIIGGFVLRIGDNQYNASIANRLQILKRELSN